MVESFNGQLRDKCLNVHWSAPMAEPTPTSGLELPVFNDMRRHTKIGIGITVAWGLVCAGLLIGRFEEARVMTLNEWGDFLAGVAAPVALLWVVIGYFQHGEEIHLNTKVLELQKEELRRQVKETATLARNAERQAKASEDLVQLSKTDQERDAFQEALAARPEFVGAGGGSSSNEIHTTILNTGGEVKDITLHYEGPHEYRFSPPEIWARAKDVNLTFVQRPHRAPLQYPFAFSLECTDRLGNRHIGHYELSGH